MYKNNNHQSSFTCHNIMPGSSFHGRRKKRQTKNWPESAWLIQKWLHNPLFLGKLLYGYGHCRSSGNTEESTEPQLGALKAEPACRWTYRQQLSPAPYSSHRLEHQAVVASCDHVVCCAAAVAASRRPMPPMPDSLCHNRLPKLLFMGQLRDEAKGDETHKLIEIMLTTRAQFNEAR